MGTPQPLFLASLARAPGRDRASGSAACAGGLSRCGRFLFRALDPGLERVNLILLRVSPGFGECAAGGLELVFQLVTLAVARGIQIVENTGPIWGPDEAWRLSDDPVLTIGVATGAEEYELYDVVAALRLNTGEIAVACGGTYEVRFYDSTGVYLRTVGRQGGGPDEYNLMWNMWRLGTDSLALFDYRNNRITVLGLRGELGRDGPPDSS